MHVEMLEFLTFDTQTRNQLMSCPFLRNWFEVGN